MTVRLKLKATVIQQLGKEALADTVSAHSYQRKLAQDQKETTRDPEALPEVGDIVGNQYRLVRRLGAGMFGSVYVAERTDVPEHRVALKVINRAVYGERNVERELVMLAAATHPNIVELKDHGMTETYVWLTMPLYEGETLAERLERGPLELREAYEIFRPIAHGLAALHDRGLRHQDIKPENIYLAKFATQLHPVLLDLGVAVEADSEFIAGTALYGAPEQLAALGGMDEPGELSPAMDTYCLGSTLLYALVGEASFPGAKARTPFDIVNAFEERIQRPLADGVLPELTGRPRKLLVEAFRRWLERDPDKRPGASTVASELEVLLEQEREAERAEERRVQRQRTMLQRVSIALGALALVVAGMSYYAISRAETLRLAEELEHVKREEQEKFADLKTCEAAHGLSRRELRACAARTETLERDHRASYASLSEKNDTLAVSLTTSNNKLVSCEEESEQAAKLWEEQRVALETKYDEAEQRCTEEKTRLETERDEAARERLQCEAKSESAQSEIAQCRQDLATCRATGDDVYAAPPPPRPAPSPAPSDSPYD